MNHVPLRVIKGEGEELKEGLVPLLHPAAPVACFIFPPKPTLASPAALPVKVKPHPLILGSEEGYICRIRRGLYEGGGWE